MGVLAVYKGAIEVYMQRCSASNALRLGSCRCLGREKDGHAGGLSIV